MNQGPNAGLARYNLGGVSGRKGSSRWEGLQVIRMEPWGPRFRKGTERAGCCR